MTGRFTILTATLAVMIVASIAVGSVTIPWSEVVAVLMGGSTSDPKWDVIIWEFRIPRTLTAVLAGMALATAGLQMQTMFRNPLAGPYVLGVDAGASLGVALVTLAAGVGYGSFFGVGNMFLGVGRLTAATVGAGLSLGLIVIIARRLEQEVSLLVVGLLFGYFASGLVSILIYLSAAESIQRYVQWTFGSFASTTGHALLLLGGTVAIGMTLALMLCRSMDALLLGDDYAASVGVDPKPVRRLVIFTTALLAATVTATCGPVGFLGVAVPHLARSIVRSARHQVVLPASALLGAIIALAADLLARGPGDSVTLPLNAITSLFGAPVLAWIILQPGGARE